MEGTERKMGNTRGWSRSAGIRRIWFHDVGWSTSMPWKQMLRGFNSLKQGRAALPAGISDRRGVRVELSHLCGDEGSLIWWCHGKKCLKRTKTINKSSVSICIFLTLVFCSSILSGWMVTTSAASALNNWMRNISSVISHISMWLNTRQIFYNFAHQGKDGI